jgi:hypothetical protein
LPDPSRTDRSAPPEVSTTTTSHQRTRNRSPNSHVSEERSVLAIAKTPVPAAALIDVAALVRRTGEPYGRSRIASETVFETSEKTPRAGV